MRVIVTGSAGFIGGAVVEILTEAGVEVVEFDRVIDPGMDVQNPSALQSKARGCDAMIHLAGLLGTHELFFDPVTAVNVNVAGTVCALQVCRDFGLRFVGIAQPRIWTNPYSITRAAARDMASAWHRNFDVPVTYIRAYNAHGPRQKVANPQKILPTFAVRGWRGDPLPVWGSGNQLVDLVEVSDLAYMFLLALEQAPGRDETIDGGTGTGVTVNDVARYVIDRTGKGSEIKHLPMRLGEDPDAPDPVAAGEGWDLVSWHPSFSWDAVGDTVDWYRDHSR